MNKLDEAFNKHMEKVYTSMCLNEYAEDDDEEEPVDSALAAANAAADGTDVDRAKETHDKELKKVIDQKTKNLKKTGSALRKPVGR